MKYTCQYTHHIHVYTDAYTHILSHTHTHTHPSGRFVNPPATHPPTNTKHTFLNDLHQRLNTFIHRMRVYKLAWIIAILDIYVLYNFDDLQSMYNIPPKHFYKYLQIRSYLLKALKQSSGISPLLSHTRQSYRSRPDFPFVQTYCR